MCGIWRERWVSLSWHILLVCVCGGESRAVSDATRLKPLWLRRAFGPGVNQKMRGLY